MAAMSNPYDQNPYVGPGGMAQPHPKGTTVLVLGILSVVMCGVGVVLGPIALVQGGRALTEIDANPAAYNNRQNVNIGRILGIIGTILSVLAIIYWIVIIVIAVSAN
jgi:hypothetical protein